MLSEFRSTKEKSKPPASKAPDSFSSYCLSIFRTDQAPSCHDTCGAPGCGSDRLMDTGSPGSGPDPDPGVAPGPGQRHGHRAPGSLLPLPSLLWPRRHIKNETDTNQGMWNSAQSYFLNCEMSDSFTLTWKRQPEMTAVGPPEASCHRAERWKAAFQTPFTLSWQLSFVISELNIL